MILRDAEILALVQGNSLQGVPLPRGKWTDASSAIQASSIDLHVGKIYLPGAEATEDGSLNKPLKEHVLMAGRTAVVTTLETLDLPADIGGFGFPPASVSSNGILMTNPGHVDPGFSGPLRFTLINMGSEPYSIRSGDKVVTLLLFRLDAPAEAPYTDRYPPSDGSGVSQDQLKRLEKDFLAFETRVETIAKKTVADAEIAVRKKQISFAFLGAVLAALLTAAIPRLLPARAPWQDKTNELDRRLTSVERVLAYDERADEIEKLLSTHLETGHSTP